MAGLGWQGSQRAQAWGWEGPLHCHCSPDVSSRCLIPMPVRDCSSPYPKAPPFGPGGMQHGLWLRETSVSSGPGCLYSLVGLRRHDPHVPQHSTPPAVPKPSAEVWRLPPTPPRRSGLAGGAVHSGKPCIINHSINPPPPTIATALPLSPSCRSLNEGKQDLGHQASVRLLQEEKKAPKKQKKNNK